MSNFGSYARYYDLLYAGKDYAAESDFVWERIVAFRPEVERVLELGCGTGGHACELAQKGWLIHAVDLSEEMLERARTRLADSPAGIASKISLLRDDIRNLRIGERVDAVISLFHVMSYQSSNEDLRLAFKTAKTHLKPGGIFIFDCWYGPAVLTDPPVVRIRRLEDEKVSIVRVAEPEIYPNVNIVDVNYQIIVKDKATGIVDEFRETHRMRYLFRPETESLLQEAGFELIECCEWMSQREPGLDSWNVYFLARA